MRTRSETLAAAFDAQSQRTPTLTLSRMSPTPNEGVGRLAS